MKKNIIILFLCVSMIAACDSGISVSPSNPPSDSGNGDSNSDEHGDDSPAFQNITIDGSEDIPEDVPEHLAFGGYGGGGGIPLTCLDVDELKDSVEVNHYPSGKATKDFCYCAATDPDSALLQVTITQPDKKSTMRDAIVTEYTDGYFCVEFDYSLGSDMIMDTYTVELSLGAYDIFQQFIPVPGYLFYGFQADEPVRLVLYSPWGEAFIAERHVNADGQGDVYIKLSSNSSWSASGEPADKGDNSDYPLIFAIGQHTSCKMIKPSFFMGSFMVDNCAVDYISGGEAGVWENQAYIPPEAEGDWFPCQGSYPSRLHVGDQAYVAYDPPFNNNVRAKPDLDGKLVGQIEPGEEFIVLDGPECSNDWVWWQISSLGQDLEGWTAEGDEEDYWLVPSE
jgi:hypothetical protein